MHACVVVFFEIHIFLILQVLCCAIVCFVHHM